MKKQCGYETERELTGISSVHMGDESIQNGHDDEEGVTSDHL